MRPYEIGTRIKLIEPLEDANWLWYGCHNRGKVFTVSGYNRSGNVLVKENGGRAFEGAAPYRFVVVPAKHKPTLEELYAAFKERHPHILDELHNLCNAAKQAGIIKVGMPHLVEVLRWNAAIKGDKVPYKINNNYRALFSRDLVKRDPSLKGFFEMRKRKGE